MSITQSAPFRRIAVELESTPYQVVIGKGALNSIGAELLAAGEELQLREDELVGLVLAVSIRSRPCGHCSHT